MKKSQKIYILLLFISILFTRCEKVKVVDGAAEGEVTGARVRLYNFTIGGVSVNFYSNEQKISAVASSNSNEAVAGTALGGTFPANQYALAPTGSRNIFAKIPMNATANPNLVIATIPGNFIDGKYYSIFTCGIYDAVNKSSDGFIVEDNFPIEFDSKVAYIRIVNPCPNSKIKMVLQKTLTVAGVKTIIEEIEVGNNVEYKRGSSFVGITPGAWELLVTDLISAKTAIRGATSFVKDRVYTIALRGNIVAGTGTPTVFLDNTVNK